MREKTIFGRMQRAAYEGIRFLCLPVFLGLVWYSLRFTQRNEVSTLEILTDTKDHMGANIAILLTLIMVCYGVSWLGGHLGDKARRRIASGVLILGLVWAFAAGLLWVNSADRKPAGDQLYTYAMASYLNEGNMEVLAPGTYLGMYPQQLGLVFWIQQIFKVAGNENYRFLQWMNAAAVVGILLAGYQILKLLWERTGANILFVLFFMCCAPIYFYTSFVYGDIPMMLCAFLAVWLLALYHRKRKAAYLIPAPLLLGIMTMVRTNGWIIVIGAVIVCLVWGAAEKKRALLITAVFMAVTPLCLSKGVISYYEKLSGYEIGGLPAQTWVMLGVEEGGLGPGWYTNRGVDYFKECGYDREETRLLSEAYIEERWGELTSSSSVFMDFYRRKLLTQWNDPLYLSLRFGTNFTEEPEEGSWLWNLCFGEGFGKMVAYADRYQFLVYAGVLLYLIFCGKMGERHILRQLLLTAIFGGFLFSLLWEAKSRYVFPWFVFMLPYAALGLQGFCAWVRQCWVRGRDQYGQSRAWRFHKADQDN